MGGMTAAVADGLPKRRIEEAAARRQARVDQVRDVIVGVNKYRLEDEDPVEILDIDNAEVRAAQVRRLASVRASRDEEACRTALGELTRVARGTAADGNLLAAAIEAARARATLGEISDAMEAAFGRHEAVPEVVSGVYAEAYAGNPEFELLRDRVAEHAAERGAAPHVLMAKMGQDGHDRGAKVVATAFADLGFRMTLSELFETPAEIAERAIAEGVDVVGVSSLAAGHRTLVPELIGALRAAGHEDIKVVCGGVIPERDHEFLKEAGVAEIFGPGTNVVEAAAAVLGRVQGLRRNR